MITEDSQSRGEKETPKRRALVASERKSPPFAEKRNEKPKSRVRSDCATGLVRAGVELIGWREEGCRQNRRSVYRWQ